MHFVALFQTAQDRDGGLDGRFGDQNRLKSPFQRRVFFDVLAVFVEGSCADGAQFAAGELRLQDVGGVDRAFCRASADDRVQFVDEQDDLALLNR